MSSSSSRRNHQQPDLTDFDIEVEVEIEVDPPAPPPPKDPAGAAARLLLRRAAELAGTTVEMAGQNEIVCVISVPLDWTECVRDAWRAIACDGERFDDGYGPRSWNGNTWVAWGP